MDIIILLTASASGWMTLIDTVDESLLSHCDHGRYSQLCSIINDCHEFILDSLKKGLKKVGRPLFTATIYGDS